MRISIGLDGMWKIQQTMTALYVHRRILEESGYAFVQDIQYCLTEEGLVDIKKIGIHPVNEQGIVGQNAAYAVIPYSAKIMALNILIEDGVIELP